MVQKSQVLIEFLLCASYDKIIQNWEIYQELDSFVQLQTFLHLPTSCHETILPPSPPHALHWYSILNNFYSIISKFCFCDRHYILILPTIPKWCVCSENLQPLSFINVFTLWLCPIVNYRRWKNGFSLCRHFDRSNRRVLFYSIYS